jgi:hypothetical protein
MSMTRGEIGSNAVELPRASAVDCQQRPEEIMAKIVMLQ